jgi:hypothetical protein
LYIAGLLPPIVNAGMLISYSFTYAPLNKRDDFYEMGNYAILFYASHVVTITIVANIVFWLKDIDPRFRDGEDANFEDIPSLVEHRKRLEMKGEKADLTNLERAKAEYFIQNIRDDLKDDFIEMKDKASAFAHIVTGGLIGSRNRQDSSVSESQRRRKFDSSRDRNATENDNDNDAGENAAGSAGGGVEAGHWHRPDDVDHVDANILTSSSNNHPFRTLDDVDVGVGVTDDADENAVHNPVLKAAGHV